MYKEFDLIEGSKTNAKSSRRKFLRNSARATGGLAGIMASGVAPAVAQPRELKMLTWAHFVPSSDEELKVQFEEFGKAAGVKVRMDRVAHLQLPALLAGEVRGQKGHDLVVASNSMPHLYSRHLENLNDLYDKIGARAGGWTSPLFGKGRDGKAQKSLPWYFISFPLAVRTDLISGIGENLPDTWDDVYRIGSKLKKRGYPLGIQLSHASDSSNILSGLLWSFGGKMVEADGKTVAINSKATVAAFKFAKTLYNDAMDEEVLAWDDRSNNVCLVSGKCSMILNPISAYRAAVRSKALIPGSDRQIHQTITHILPPEGPAGRHMSASFAGIGVWKFAKQKELAKEFLDFHFTRDSVDKHLRSSGGFNQPVLKNFAMNPLYASNSKYYFAQYIGWYTHAIGYPGIPTAAAQMVSDQFLLPDAMAACATGKHSPEEAAAKLEKQVKRIYRRFNKKA